MSGPGVRSNLTSGADGCLEVVALPVVTTAGPRGPFEPDDHPRHLAIELHVYRSAETVPTGNHP
jgi:hypothetical protein